MELTYTGPHDRVEVPLPDGGVAEAERGGTIDVPDELGGALLVQAGNWQPAKRRGRKEGDD